MTEPDCEYPLSMGGCTKAGTVEIKHEVKDPDTGEVIEKVPLGMLCQDHGMELLVKQMGRVTPSQEDEGDAADPMR